MKKWMIGVGVASTFAIGSVVFTGGDIIDNAISYVQGVTSNIEKYEYNEKQLVTKLNEIKLVKEEMQVELENLIASGNAKDDEIESLTTQISQKDEEITNLNKEIEDLRSLLGQTESLYDEIKRLENEVTKANTKANELNVALENTTLGTPLSKEELELSVEDSINIFWGIDKAVALNGLNVSIEKYVSESDGSLSGMVFNCNNTTDRTINVQFVSGDYINRYEMTPGYSNGIYIYENSEKLNEYTYDSIIVDGFKYNLNIKK